MLQNKFYFYAALSVSYPLLTSFFLMLFFLPLLANAQSGEYTPTKNILDTSDLEKYPAFDRYADWVDMEETRFINNPFNITNSRVESHLDFYKKSNGLRYDFDLKDGLESKRTWFTESISCGSKRAIVYEINPTEKRGGTEKIMHKLFSRSLDNNIRFGEERYIGFTFNIPSRHWSLLTPQEQAEIGGMKGSLIFQLWQGTPYTPPFAAFIRQNESGETVLRVEVRGEDTYNSVKKVVAHEFPIKFDVCNEIIMRVIPEYDSDDGILEMYLYDRADGVFYEEFKWTGKWGFDPENPQGLFSNRNARPNEQMQFIYGIYRRQQDTQQRIVFDEIRTGSSLSSVLRQ